MQIAGCQKAVETYKTSLRDTQHQFDPEVVDHTKKDMLAEMRLERKMSDIRDLTANALYMTDPDSDTSNSDDEPRDWFCYGALKAYPPHARGDTTAAPSAHGSSAASSTVEQHQQQQQPFSGRGRTMADDDEKDSFEPAPWHRGSVESD